MSRGGKGLAKSQAPVVMVMGMPIRVSDKASQYHRQAPYAPCACGGIGKKYKFCCRSKHVDQARGRGQVEA